MFLALPLKIVVKIRLYDCVKRNTSEQNGFRSIKKKKKKEREKRLAEYFG